ncbi:MAG: hypothetical protein IJT66_05810, partial [Clostridia bacterium]|nr:hypothetical protein [Clostridia bacterium]
DEIDGEDGVYIRIRNIYSTAKTYTVTVTSSDVGNAAPQSSGEEIEPFGGHQRDFLVTSPSVKVDGSSKVKSGKATIKATVPAGGYFQYKQKLTDIIGGSGYCNIKLGKNTVDDYLESNFQLQLTTDALAADDIVPVNESTNLPDDRGITYYINDSAGYLWIGSGNSLAGATRYTWNDRMTKFGDCDNGISLRFLHNEDDTVACRNTRQDLINAGVAGIKNSNQTLAQVGGEEGVYIRIRNNAVQAVTFTLTVYSQDAQPIISNAYTDGNWIFSDPDTVKISAESKEKKGVFTETLKATLAPNGYVQLNEKLAYLFNNDEAQITIQVGNGSVEAYEAARVQIQLTADETASTDIVPVDERTEDPGTKGMTWIFWGTSGRMWTGRGKTTAGGGYYCGPDLIANMHGGLKLLFYKEGDGKISYDTAVRGMSTFSNHLISTKTLDEIGGEGGVYVRLRNAAEFETDYTITVQYTKGMVESTPVNGKGWIVKGRTEDGVEIADETVDTYPGFRTWNLLMPNNTYAQYETKITDMADAMFRYDPGEWHQSNYEAAFAFVLNPNAPWDPTQPGGDPREFLIMIKPGSDPENTHLLFPSGTVVEGKTGLKPTVCSLLTAGNLEAAGGFTISFIKENGHWYLNISGKTIDGSIAGDALEPYIRMDEYVEKGAYFRVYARNIGTSYARVQTAISSAVVPEITTDDQDEDSETEGADTFIEYYTDMIDSVRSGNRKTVSYLHDLWGKLSYLDQSNVEAYFFDDMEPYDLLQRIKDYYERTVTIEEEVEVTTYETVYETVDPNGDGQTVVTTDPIIGVRKKKKKAAQDDFPLWAIIAIAAGGVVVIGGGVTLATILLKRKKKADLKG